MISRMSRKVALAASGASLALAGTLISANPAFAATNWTATGTQADVVGAYAHGSFDYGTSGGTSVANVTIRDSVSDGASARVYFRWRFIDGRVSGPAVFGASGYLNETTQSFSQPRNNLDTAQPFEVRECRVDNGLEVECGWDYDVPHPYN